MSGIEEASQDLKKETEDQLWQQGVLRHVPLVGTFVNWWAPPPKTAVRGRKLDLAEGELTGQRSPDRSRNRSRRRSREGSRDGHRRGHGRITGEVTRELERTQTGAWGDGRVGVR